VALTRSGFVFTWGKGDYHRLGHGTDDHVRRPRKVAALQGRKVVSIATGSLHCVACTDQGEVYTWGDNDEGQLGDGSTNAIQRPRLVAALQQSKKINRVACGSAHTLAWSTNKPIATSKMPAAVSAIYNFGIHCFLLELNTLYFRKNRVKMLETGSDSVICALSEAPQPTLVIYFFRVRMTFVCRYLAVSRSCSYQSYSFFAPEK
jgi:hypothetical protein